MSELITVFEYGYLSSTTSDQRCTRISQAAFDYLEALCLREDESSPSFLRLCSFDRNKALQVRNYVGVIHTPAGQQIEVLPKITRTNGADSHDSARQSLLNMLRHLREFKHIETTDAQVATRKLPLFEVFIRQFLESVSTLVKRGLRSEYVRREDNQCFMKGKLLTTKQLKHNLVNKHRFYVEYDEYLLDRPVNRLIHTALNKVAAYSRSNDNQKLCRELMFAFSDVPCSHHVKNDFAAINVTRGMDHYQKPLAWTRLILEGVTPLSMQGKAEAISLLFPMEAVFEAYVGSILRKQLQAPYSLKEQARSQYLVEFNGSRWFNLRPDLLIEKSHKPVIVMDTKWKLVNSQKANGSEKMGMSQADFYQMFAYGQKYLNGQGELVLIYPKTDAFEEPVAFSFDFSEHLKLWVVPFDIADGVKDEDRLILSRNSPFLDIFCCEQ
ncbi:McrC family protein [Endozoicomonas lisbonensis]|uniref:5-methylcytosine-specific restriction enzyme subunit McrC n=1 Tax=Endozoicomonas lisbonensis TaxID=3120522 RepID=A0ABV2SL62_9GAMM